MTADVVKFPSSRFRDMPLTPQERRTFGDKATRCTETGFLFEDGLGALPRAQQTANFKRLMQDRDWIESYKHSDPDAKIRHPELFEEKPS
jgi:hypothetical protein